MQTPSDDELVKRISRQDAAAMRVLFARHRLSVFRFAMRLTREESAAEDIVAEVFLDIWRQAGAFEHRSAVATWALAIARNKAWSLLRKRKETPLEEGVAEAMEDDSDDPEIAAQKADKSAALRACMARLSPEHREVVDLVYYHEQSLEEVARIVGAPENTVKTRLFHARKKLSEHMLALGFDRGWP
jgi:RNA polymerase sigma-70 factor (ECF subfamily)